MRSALLNQIVICTGQTSKIIHDLQQEATPRVVDTFLYLNAVELEAEDKTSQGKDVYLLRRHSMFLKVILNNIKKGTLKYRSLSTSIESYWYFALLRCWWVVHSESHGAAQGVTSMLVLFVPATEHLHMWSYVISYERKLGAV